MSLGSEGSEAMSPDEWRRQHDAVSETINRTVLGLTALSLFCFETLDAPDKVLIAAQADVLIPFTNAPVRFDHFLYFGPVLVTAVGAYLHVFVGYWNSLNTSPLGIGLPFLFNMQRRVPRLMATLLFYWLIPLDLSGFVWKARPRPESFQFRLLLLWAMGGAVLMFYLYLRRSRPSSRRILVAILLGASAAIGIFCLCRVRALDLSGEDLKNLDLRGRYLRGATLTGASLEGVRLDEADLNGADLSRSNLQRAQLPDARLYGARLRHANLTGATLDRALLAEADLEGADLRNASFVGAYLGGASLAKANLSGASLSSAVGLTQEQSDQACVDQRTTLPAGLRRPAQCGSP